MSSITLANTFHDPDPPPTPPLELSEVLYNLVQFLDRKSLVQVALVCRSWSKLFSPMLYQDIRVKDWEYPGFISKFREHLPEIVKLEWKKSRQEAKRRYKMTLNALPPHDLLDDPNDHSALPFLPSMDNMCLADLASILAPEKTRRLRLLVIHGETNLRQFLITILPRIPALTCLKIEDSLSWQKYGINEILNACQSLQSLDCDSSVSLQFNECLSLPYPINKDGSFNSDDAAFQECLPPPLASSSVAPLPLRLPTHTLRVLRLHKTSLSDQELLTFVRECPQLEELYLHQESALAGGLPVSTTSATQQWNWSTEFAANLSHACPKLVKLHISPGCFQSLPEDIIQTALTAFPKLHSLGTPFSKFGDETMQTIIDTRTGTDLGTMSRTGIAYLTSLDIRNLKGHRFSSPVLQQFLERCATLVHFWADDQVLHVQDMIVDHATDTIRMWACRRLETLVLGFQFNNMSGLDVDRAVYQQLGQLMQLRRLEILSARPVFSMLSGLSLLQDLKVLQYYGIARWIARSRYFDEEEQEESYSQMEGLEWVARTWTCLQELYMPVGIQRAKSIAAQLRQLGRNIAVVPKERVDPIGGFFLA
ncbi:hypothetical protein CPB97_006365 [Podila verticillata]|nr:hypothetical protein CPB97_006365 [Podila verticillata]